MAASDLQADQFLYNLLQGTEGINTNIGEMRMKPQWAREINNFQLRNGGGLETCSGLDLKAIIPFPIQKIVVYNTPPGPLSLFFNRQQIFAIAAPFIYKVDIDNQLVTKVPNFSVTATSGRPFPIQYKEKLVIVDGVNKPYYFNGTSWQYFPKWPMDFVSQNNGNVFWVYALADNPAQEEVGIPSFGCIWKNRLLLSGDKKFPFRVYFSFAEDILDFDVVADSSPIIDTGGFFDMDSDSEVTSLSPTTNFLSIYCRSNIRVMSGTNPPVSENAIDPWDITVVNSQIGCVSPFAITQFGNSDQLFLSDLGVYALKTSDTFQTVKSAIKTYQIQNQLPGIGAKNINKAIFTNDLAEGILYMAVPSKSNRKYRNKFYKFNHLITDAQDNQTDGWSIAQNLGTYFRCDDVVYVRSRSVILLAAQNKLYVLNAGSLDYEGNPVQSQYTSGPHNPSGSANNHKFLSARLRYKTKNGCKGVLSYSWTNGGSGSVEFSLGGYPGAEYASHGGDSGYSADSSGGNYTSTAQFESFYKQIDIPSSGKRGNILKYDITILEGDIDIQGLEGLFQLDGIPAR